MTDIRADQGITENEIIRVAHRVAAGQNVYQIREMYKAEGKEESSAVFAYHAATTYLKIQERNFLSERQTKPTRREMKAIKLCRHCGSLSESCRCGGV